MFGEVRQLEERHTDDGREVDRLLAGGAIEQFDDVDDEAECHAQAKDHADADQELLRQIARQGPADGHCARPAWAMRGTERLRKRSSAGMLKSASKAMIHSAGQAYMMKAILGEAST